MRLIIYYTLSLLLWTNSIQSEPPFRGYDQFPKYAEISAQDTFTGVSILEYEDKSLESINTYVKGERYGPSISFLENGDFFFIRTNLGEGSPDFSLRFHFGRGSPYELIWKDKFRTTNLYHRYDSYSKLLEREKIEKEGGEITTRSYYRNGCPLSLHKENSKELKESYAWYSNGILCSRHIVKKEPIYVNKAEYWLPDGNKIAELILDENWKTISETFWDRSGKLLKNPPLKSTQIEAISTYRRWENDEGFWP